jgi:hypothetical protein
MMGYLFAAQEARARAGRRVRLVLNSETYGLCCFLDVSQRAALELARQPPCLC